MKRIAASFLAALLPSFTLAANDGIATRGATGGLTIPSGAVLDNGTIAFTASNYQEPQYGANIRRRSLTFGVGIMPNLEVFGRYANFEDPLPGTGAINGVRDISANIKYRLPVFWHRQPEIAIGVTDIGGAASNFGATYVVASDSLGWFDWTLGYARGSTFLGSSRGRTFEGVFGGVQVRAGATGLSAIAEYDGQQKYVGLRYRSPGIGYLGGTQVIASVQREFGATRVGPRADEAKTSATVSVLVPLSEIADRPRTFKPERALKSLDAAGAAMNATPQDRAEALQKALAGAGLERARVGTIDRDLVVEYENHVFGQTEADALGIVLGLAAEYAPAGISRIRAVTLKAGLPVYTSSVGVAEFRSFLRTGDTGAAGGSLTVDPGAAAPTGQVQWFHAPGRRNWAHLELAPELNNTVATELGVFDYSLAANLKAFVPLWRGGEVVADVVQRIDNTQNFEPGNYFGEFRHRNGLRSIALQQSLWFGKYALFTGGIGRYRYDRLGVELDTTVFFPGRADVLRFKGAVHEREPGERKAKAMPLSAIYRWVPRSDTWVEAGAHQYTDGTRGPSLAIHRWFGEVGANVFLRRGGDRTFGGLELTIPLTPRRGADVAVFTLNGTQQFSKDVRTRIRIADGINFVELGGVLDYVSPYDAQQRLLNGGHHSEKYFLSRLHRMREAFFLYARDRLPD